MASKTTKRKAPAGKSSASRGKSRTAGSKKSNSTPFSKNPVVPWIFGAAALFLSLVMLYPSAMGVFGRFFYNLFRGIFSGGAYAVPVIFFVFAFNWKKDTENSFVKYRILIAAAALLNLSVFLHGINGRLRCFDPVSLYNDGKHLRGGGIIGGFTGSCLKFCIGTPGLFILSSILLLVFGFFLFGMSPRALVEKTGAWFASYRENRAENRKSRVRYTDKPEAYMPDEDYVGDDYDDGDYSEETRHEPDIDDFFAGDFEEDREKADAGYGEGLTPVNTEFGKKKFPDSEGTVDLVSIFGGEDAAEETPAPAADEAGEDAASGDKPEEEKPAEPEKPKYVFPPASLLKYEKGNGLRTETPEQLKASANKLVDTLKSFNVKTHLVNISRGPTITRYELAPEEGVRVRSIANLVDDISLSLATSGVRIEAPIPGKAAVGIEVPNNNVATVYLRELIENDAFRNNKSRVSVALGMDVAGKPIYLDISKMPHLLIAGATGMGKSVCINSMIVSMLYKASPDEVKLILIDPKKVELNIYNSLPHLIVPVVSDPKKAAGSLQWAVKEMERRFELIESVGVRDIYNYNKETSDDPSFEYLPQIVIIIDELADLMMTAPDSVESSICRLAQKARAAGMHLVIGTQRPSVDVITGLIKANIPSRIAFTVSSQVDSRTIIDMSGAEKLIGRGDMLFAPVGCSKPMRVQGAFVSEQEVEAITEYIKKHCGDSSYSDEVLENIEKEAARCVVKKTPGEIPENAGAGDGDDDPLYAKAVEIAVEGGKVSTSYLQRHLSVGYGRAAKLIDMMEQRGIVGPPDGNKPRQILISKEAYMEMKVSSSDE